MEVLELTLYYSTIRILNTSFIFEISVILKFSVLLLLVWAHSIFIFLIILDVTTITVCAISSALCLRSLRQAWRLMNKSSRFFRKTLGHVSIISEQLEFLDFWLLLIIFNDLLSIAGSIFKIFVDLHVWFEIKCSFIVPLQCH